MQSVDGIALSQTHTTLFVCDTNCGLTHTPLWCYKDEDGDDDDDVDDNDDEDEDDTAV